jgi:homoserine O-acetyltransferase
MTAATLALEPTVAPIVARRAARPDVPTRRPTAREGAVALGARWPLTHGGTLDGAVAAYRLYDVGEDDRRPVVVVLGGISAGRHATASADDPSPGWWEPVVGPGRAVDTTTYRVLSLDYVGGSGRSTGPRRPAVWRRDGCQSGAPFPAIDTRDQARALLAVLDHLGIERLHAIVGSSYGGMVALALGEAHADRFERAVVISAAHEAHPMATALRSVQREVVRLGLETGRSRDAIRLARGLAMTTYRTAEEFADRFAGAPDWTACGPRFPVQAYLDAHGERFADAFSPASFLCLSESIDLHRVDPTRLTRPTTLVAVESDVLVPTWQIRALRDAVGGPVSFHEIASRYGHDAFLKEVDAVSAIVREALG